MTTQENFAIVKRIETQNTIKEYINKEAIWLYAELFLGHTDWVIHIQIEKLVRKGKYNQNGICPISVTFSHHRDLLEILFNREYLPA